MLPPRCSPVHPIGPGRCCAQHPVEDKSLLPCLPGPELSSTTVKRGGNKQLLEVHDIPVLGLPRGPLRPAESMVSTDSGLGLPQRLG